ncbi:hypothetical protein, partial [Flavobacterium sp.]|uniref:hypothetical protein n=1 Tax=Flavobacterium sp. TaxID=239 RepID=UPI00333FC9A9
YSFKLITSRTSRNLRAFAVDKASNGTRVGLKLSDFTPSWQRKLRQNSKNLIHNVSTKLV